MGRKGGRGEPGNRFLRRVANKVPPAMMPEQWVAEEKLMPGALHGYAYVEDGVPPAQPHGGPDGH
jgi:hypothetical protein